MSIHELILKNKISSEVLQIVSLLLEDEAYTKKHCAKNLVEMLHNHDLLDKYTSIDEIEKSGILEKKKA